MYKLHAPLINNSNGKIPIIKILFKEILGYNDKEIEQFINTKFMCDIAINLSLEQAQQIAEPFYENDIQIYLYDQKNNTPLFWQKDLGICLVKNQPKKHYYDNPIISREHLVDPFIKQEKEKQYNIQQNNIEQNIKLIITCPYCKSTDTKKITRASKAVHTFFFGLHSAGRNSKNFHCNNCDSDF